MLSVFAEGLGAPRFMALDGAGVVYVADRAGGRVVRLVDADSDGVADTPEVVLNRLNAPHSIAFHDGYLYVAETDQIVRVSDDDGDGLYEQPKVVIADLPTGGHWSRTIVFGPDGMLYLAVGSSCNVCWEDEAIRATVSRYNADGTGGEIVAVGLRNAVGLAFDAGGQLWATNNGRDMLGDDVPPETLNLITDGADFGWPRCHAGDIVDPDFGGDAGCQNAVPPAVEMQAHSAPLGLTFLDAHALDGSLDGDALIAFHGSWNRSEPTGYKVVRVVFKDGSPTGEVTDLVSGFLLDDGDAWGRPVDVLQIPDGSVLISDDSGGRIFRLSVAGE
ncbi:MAG: PQQ-dependent sugar dehydrogenase [Thermomicrobiales bacterium]|nr:PQQ-dependent sugar dehydrogenase [Thermomicrobiales bacterium]